MGVGTEDRRGRSAPSGYHAEDKIRSQEDWEHVKYKLDETIEEVSPLSRTRKAAAEADLSTPTCNWNSRASSAPFAGVVGRSSVRSSQEVKKGDVLFWVTAEAPLRVLFTVPESAMADFSSGKPLELTTADYPGLRQTGTHSSRQPGRRSASGSVQVIAAVVQSVAAAQARNVHADPSRAMNLSEAFDAALPEIPETRYARSRPPRLDPDLIVREDDA